MKVEESLNVTFDETPPPPKTPPLEDDELVEEEAIEVSKTKPIGNDLEDISLENNQMANIKESKSHPLENVIGTTNLGLWYPKGSVIETIVYADSDHKQTALAISTIEVRIKTCKDVRKACQQALWMKQALVDYDIRLDDIPIMCDNKGAIDLSKNPSATLFVLLAVQNVYAARLQLPRRLTYCQTDKRRELLIMGKDQHRRNDVKVKAFYSWFFPMNITYFYCQDNDAKTMFAAIETRFGVWMNKAEIEIMSIDDLYNFKIVEQNVKKSIGASSGSQTLAFITAPSTSSTNDVNTTKPAYEVSTVSSNVNTASPQVSIASFSDNAVYAFMIENPNGSNLLQQDLKQIHEDDLEVIDLKWQLSLLSMRAKRYYQRTCKKIFINANDTVGYDKSKVECFNCHKMGHFSREYKAPRNKEGQFRNQDNTRKQGNNKDASSKAMLAIDGVGFDWSNMAEEQVHTNMVLMAFPDFEVYNDKTCSNTCLKNFETLKKQCDDLIVKLNQTEFTATTYKRGLATVEEQLITYRKNEVLFSEEVAVLKREVACKDYEINVLKSEFEKVKQEKEGIEFKIEKFDKASKDLDKLLGSQITDKSKKGLGYSAVPPPHPLIYNRPKKLDLSYSGLDEFKEPEFKGYGPENSKQESNIVCDKKSDDSKENSDNSLVKEQVSKDTSSFVESSLNVDKETVFPVDKKVESVKPKNHEKPVKKSVRYAEMYRSQTPRGNQRNWNGQKSNQLGSDFVMYNKACFICGSFNHVQAQCKYHQREGMVYGNTYKRVNYNYTTNRTHPNAQRNMVPRAVLMKTGLKTFNTARTVNTAHHKTIVFSAKPIPRFSKPAQSTVRRPFQTKTTLYNKRFTQKVNTAKAQAVNTARPKVVKTARPNSAVVNAVRVNQANAVKASACWVWRPTKPNSASITFKKHNYIDARGRSKASQQTMMIKLICLQLDTQGKRRHYDWEHIPYLAQISQGI
ncbi:putative ribonuclease H-like domain-containing protein [Tanacetum coccineum]